MPTYNLECDFETGATLAVGKDGGRYTMQEIDAAERDANRGDVGAVAFLRNVDLGLDETGRRLSPDEVKARLHQMIDDCPECQAARARGEQPLVTWMPASIEPPRLTNSHARRRERERRRRSHRRRQRYLA